MVQTLWGIHGLIVLDQAAAAAVSKKLPKFLQLLGTSNPAIVEAAAAVAAVLISAAPAGLSSVLLKGKVEGAEAPLHCFAAALQLRGKAPLDAAGKGGAKALPSLRWQVAQLAVLGLLHAAALDPLVRCACAADVAVREAVKAIVGARGHVGSGAALRVLVHFGVQPPFFGVAEGVLRTILTPPPPPVQAPACVSVLRVCVWM